MSPPAMTPSSLQPASAALLRARLTLHHAIQLVAAVGQSLAPAEPDDGQQALAVAGAGLWLGAPVAGGRLRAGLEPEPAALSLRGPTGAPLAVVALEGRTLADGLSFLEEALQAAGVPRPTLALPVHPADFPAHPLGSGVPFPSGDAGGRAALAGLLALGQDVLARVVAGRAPVRLWPHHFDLGASLHVGRFTVGLGVSPGDGTEGLPYAYATFWPRPGGGPLPALAAGGRWRTEGWAGAELPLGSPGPEDGARIEAFLASALAAAEHLEAAGPAPA